MKTRRKLSMCLLTILGCVVLVSAEEISSNGWIRAKREGKEKIKSYLFTVWYHYNGISARKFCLIEDFECVLYFLFLDICAIKCNCTFCNSQLCIMHFIRTKKIVALVFITLN